ncbi:MAG: SGNH/GDSL hydrolase family protein [Verrucomicrobia bacterium]|nr:SGNH/GDSL hydrolase family protein [Verrucomicrobiota bacterium]MDA1065046.1 SGNH/GDSL hydrolase family protein [Verrucomicrobiota bacterium]
MDKNLKRFRLLIAATGVLTTFVACSPQAPFLKSGQRVVFLGDSNTYTQQYVNFIEASLLTQAPGLKLDILNLGLPSETTSGLSEPDHPFPRPNVHERLDRVLTIMKPDIVIACYGMNDGMYYPQNPDRFVAHKNGINELINKVHASGAKLILLTPPPFDPLPQRKQGKLLPKDAPKFAWFSIYENYDSVLEDYSNWQLSLKDDRVEAVIDIRGPILKYIAEQRNSNPDYVMSNDGVHFNEDGHRIIANNLLNYWGFDSAVKVDPALQNLVSERQQLLRDAWLTHCGHKRPNTKTGFPLEEAQKKAAPIWEQIQVLVR